MDEKAKTLILFLIGWAIYRYLKGQPLLPTALTTKGETLPATETGAQLRNEEQWELVRGPDGSITKVIHRWR